MAASDAQSPTPAELADAARAASRLRSAIRRSGLVEVWPSVALDALHALVNLGQVTPTGAIQLAEFLDGVQRPASAPAIRELL